MCLWRHIPWLQFNWIQSHNIKWIWQSKQLHCVSALLGCFLFFFIESPPPSPSGPCQLCRVPPYCCSPASWLVWVTRWARETPTCAACGRGGSRLTSCRKKISFNREKKAKAWQTSVWFRFDRFNSKNPLFPSSLHPGTKFNNLFSYFTVGKHYEENTKFLFPSAICEGKTFTLIREANWLYLLWKP